MPSSPAATTQTKWYSIRAKAPVAASAAQDTSAEIFIYGDIGESWYGNSVAASDFVKEVAALDVTQITVHINSYGGSVTDGIAIYNALVRHKASVTITIDAVAASIASLIAMAGDRVEMADNALLMVHAPWSYAAGNSKELREFADLLDTWALAMSSSYTRKTGRPADEILALLQDGQDHWYTATEAQSEKFIDAIVDALPIAASAMVDVRAMSARYPNMPRATAAVLPVAAVAAQSQENTMPTTGTPVPVQPAPAASTTATPATQVNEGQIRATALAQDQQRRTAIRALATARIVAIEGSTALLTACEDDINCSIEQAGQRLLAHISSGAAPVNSPASVVTVEDERDKFHAAVSIALLARANVQDKGKEGNGDKVVKNLSSNPYRGHRLMDIARECLARASISTRGMTPMEIVAAAFTQSTGDFPVLLENVMHKALLTAYGTAPDTWTRFCAKGTVGDFRAHNRYRLGSLGDLDDLNELGEFKNKDIPDGEKSSVSVGTKGNIINISRPMVINDDLGAFVGLAAMLGRASRRTIESTVYKLLAENGGLGPVMQDGKTLFHADHGNLAATGAAPSVAAFESARVAMASHKDISGNDYLDIRPALWLGPLGISGTARVVNDSQYDPDAEGKLQRPNLVRGLFSDVIDSARLSGTAWRLLADPADAPVIEVDFLDGNEDPYLELQQGFSVDGARWKVRLDFGATAIDYRGAYFNKGA